jgi:hypothetical protein
MQEDQRQALSPFSASIPRASYTACREMAPISARTSSAIASAVLWGRSLTARNVAKRWAVTWTPCSRRRVAGSLVMAGLYVQVWALSIIGLSPIRLRLGAGLGGPSL